MKLIKPMSLLILIALFISNTAMAEGKKLSEKLSGSALVIKFEVNSCNADADKLCPGLTMNSKKSFMCLMAYEEKLSDACKIGIIEATIALEMSVLAIDYSIKACEADADKHCLKVKPGEGRIVSCLKKNESKLDKKCTAALKDTGIWNLSK